MSAKALLIGGHPRSGTTLLCRVMNSHPDVALTYEFRTFMGLNMRYRKSIAQLRRNWYKRSILDWRARKTTGTIQETFLILRYLIHLYAYRQPTVGTATITQALNQIFPDKAFVGDKYPGYIFRLNRLVDEPDLQRIIIYRDCRDVAVSAIKMANTKWRTHKVKQNMNSADKVAARWLKAMQKMEEHEEYIHIIRYEDILSSPDEVMGRLAQRLALDPDGFKISNIRSDNSGKFKTTLTEADLADIDRIAGDMMRKYDYT